MSTTRQDVESTDKLYSLRDFAPVLQAAYGIERSYETLRRWAMRKEKPLPVVRPAGVAMCSLRMFQQFVTGSEPVCRISEL
jgi:hypothetical protein